MNPLWWSLKIHIYSQTLIHSQNRPLSPTRTSSFTHTRAHTHTHFHTYIYAHTHTRARTSTRTHIWIGWWLDFDALLCWCNERPVTQANPPIFLFLVPLISCSVHFIFSYLSHYVRLWPVALRWTRTTTPPWMSLNFRCQETIGFGDGISEPTEMWRRSRRVYFVLVTGSALCNWANHHSPTTTRDRRG